MMNGSLIDQTTQKLLGLVESLSNALAERVAWEDVYAQDPILDVVHCVSCGEDGANVV